MQPPDPYWKLRSPPPSPADEICGCPGEPAIKLMGAIGPNPIHCLDCNLEIPPERIPVPAILADELALWTQTYCALEHLSLLGDYEKWAEAHLENISSSINKHGRELTRQLNALRRCYYWHHQDQSVPFWTPASECPVCQHGLTEYRSRRFFPQLVCEACSIVVAGE